MTVGSTELAEWILTNSRTVDYGERDGWRRIGEGLYRTVYLGPDGVAYKVPRGRSNTSSARSNIAEARERDFIAEKADNASETLGFRVIIPECTLHGVVLAMEHIVGDFTTGEDGCDVHWKIEDYLGIWDMHSQNVLKVEEDAYAVIDFAAG
jgi:hypothetical protein